MRYNEQWRLHSGLGIEVPHCFSGVGAHVIGKKSEMASLFSLPGPKILPGACLTGVRLSPRFEEKKLLS